MAAILQTGCLIVLSKDGPVPALVGFPRGKIRLRMRPGRPVVAYVRNAGGTEKWFVKEKDGVWVPAFMRSRNVTVPDTRR